ncbi:MAG: thioredoxin family protein [Planctomycetota bacterium]
MIRICSLLFAAVSCTVLSAGEYNRVLDIGDAAPVWKDLVGVDDEKHSLDDLRSKSVVVVVFTCNTCPYSVGAEDRVISLEKKYKDRGVAVVAINVNKVKGDQLPAMKERAKSKSFPFPYLHDPSQQIAKQYGAKYTPEFFVLDQQRRVIYMGSLDDSPDGKSVGMRYVQVAVEAALSGQKPQITETLPIGCRVRYDRVVVRKGE